MSFSSSCSSSLLESLNSASSISSCSYWALYQVTASSALVASLGGDDGMSNDMMGGGCDSIQPGGAVRFESRRRLRGKGERTERQEVSGDIGDRIE